MASYKEAIWWIAHNDAEGDTPPGMNFEEAFRNVDGNVTVVMVADVWGKDQRQVAVDVLKERGFDAPRGYVAALAIQ